MISTRKIGTAPLYLNPIIAGEKGAGKTLLACTAGQHPEMGPALLVNIEDGGVTASHLDGCDETEQLATFKDAQEVFWNLANKTKDEDTDWGSYRTVIVDSGTALQSMNIMEVARDNGKGSNEFRITQQDWGDSTRMVEELLRRFKALPLNTIVTAGVRNYYTTDNAIQKEKVGPARVTPDFTPALANKLMYLYDHVWYLAVADDGTRQLLTRDSGPYKAKTRGQRFADQLGEVVDNPNLGEIFNLYKETQAR